MTESKFIMWGCAALLAFVLWGVDTKLSAMQEEHHLLLSLGQVNCYNQAELPPFYDVVIESDHYHIEADAEKEKLWLAKSSPKST